MNIYTLSQNYEKVKKKNRTKYIYKLKVNKKSIKKKIINDQKIY